MRMPGHTAHTLRGERGLSLIELVVAMALFALIAVMGLQGLTGSIRLSARLGEVDRQSADLGFAMDFLRNDLTATVPMLFFPPNRGAPVSALAYDGARHSLEISVGGQATMEGRVTNMRAQWRFEPTEGTLQRRVWPLLTPANATSVSPDRVVLTGVEGFVVESYWAGFGWVPGVSVPGVINAPTAATDSDQTGPAPEVYSDLLPLAVAVIIATERFGEIRLVEALQ